MTGDMMRESAGKKPLIVLTGPTAVGKSRAAVNLAKVLGGEIVSADSMQVYRHMDIGSAKITREEMQGVPHHLIDILEPTEDFNVVLFQSLAREALAGIFDRGNIPVVAGGTGFYIQALLYDIDFNGEASDPALRAELEELADREGMTVLHRMLAEVDPESADNIHPNNRKRVIRALEYYRLTGERISDHNRAQREKESPYDFTYYVLTCSRDLLYKRIDERVDCMVDAGLVDEVRALKDMGCHRGMVSMQGLGYKEILDYLDGICSLEEAVNAIKRDTRHFAKRQLTWFKRERSVQWLTWEEFDFNEDLLLKKMTDDIIG